MSGKILKLLPIVLFALLSGCATPITMPLSQSLTDVDVSDKSILVAKFTIKNEKAPSHQPDLCCIFLEEEGEQYSFIEPPLVKESDEHGKEYLVSLKSKPGKTKINMARFTRHVPMLLMASAELQLQEEIEVPQNSIVYLGNVNAVIKKKSDSSDPSAGSVIPLIDQAVAGFSTGTFVVDITDKFESDMLEFYQRYPYLKGKKITKMILPEWVHPDVRKNTVVGDSGVKE